MKMFCKSIKQHTKRMMDLKKKKLPLTSKKLKFHKEANGCYMRWIRFFKKSSNYINYQKVRDHYHYTGKHRGAAYRICNLKFNLPNEVPVVFHNRSKHDFYFIIKELVNEFDGQFKCIG